MDKMTREEIENCFIERNENTIFEKISYCITEKKMNPDDATYLVTQVVKNLPKYLLPLKVKSQEGNPDHSSKVMDIQKRLTV